MTRTGCPINGWMDVIDGTPIDEFSFKTCVLYVLFEI